METLYEKAVQKPLLKIGIPDKFIECGSLPYLQTKYGLTARRVEEQVTAWIGGKVPA